MVIEQSAAGPPGQGAPLVLRAWQEAALPVVIGELKARKRPIVAAIMGAGKSVLIAALIRQSREQEGRGVIVLAPRTSLVEQLAGTFGKVLGATNVGQWWEAEKQADRRVTVSTYQSLPTLVEAWRKLGRTCALLVCDEAHRTEAAVILEAVGSLETLAPGRWLARIGVTATPFRSDDKEALSLWDSVAFRYGYKEAVRDRVLVPYRVINWEGGGDPEDVDRICADMLITADRWPALVNAKTIADAEEYAVYLGKRGIPAMAIHSQLNRKEQASRIGALRTGAVKALVHVSMLAEGSDFPWLRTLVLRRPVGAIVRFVQEVGRVLRIDPNNPEKVDGLILDPFDLMGILGMKHPEALGKALDGATADALEEDPDGEGNPDLREEKKKKAVAKRPVAQWLWKVASGLEDHGLEMELRMSAEAPITERQAQAITKMAGFLRYIPNEKARGRIRDWTKSGKVSELTRREAGLMLSVLFWISRATQAARDHGRNTGDWAAADRLFSWPEDAEVPEEVPELPSERREAMDLEAAKVAVKQANVEEKQRMKAEKNAARMGQEVAP